MWSWATLCLSCLKWNWERAFSYFLHSTRSCGGSHEEIVHIFTVDFASLCKRSVTCGWVTEILSSWVIGAYCTTVKSSNCYYFGSVASRCRHKFRSTALTEEALPFSESAQCMDFYITWIYSKSVQPGNKFCSCELMAAKKNQIFEQSAWVLLYCMPTTWNEGPNSVGVLSGHFGVYPLHCCWNFRCVHQPKDTRINSHILESKGCGEHGIGLPDKVGALLDGTYNRGPC